MNSKDLLKFENPYFDSNANQSSDKDRVVTSMLKKKPDFSALPDTTHRRLIS